MHDNLSALGGEPAGTSGDASPCPTPHTVALFCGYTLGKFVRGEGSGLTRDEARQISRHMRECARCVARFNAIVDVSQELDDGDIARIWPGPAVAVAALVVAAVGLMFMVIAESPADRHRPTSADQFNRGEILNIELSPQTESHDAPPQMHSQQPNSRSSASRSTPRDPRVLRTHDQVSSSQTRHENARVLMLAAPAVRSAAPVVSASMSPWDALVRPIKVASAGQLTFWRLTPRGVIARSSDGVDWQPLSSGTSNDLVAGSAPTAEICWLVGRAGTVLRTLDGEQWQQIAAPIDADLVSITAIDESSATISTADGRKFSTHDGGISWNPGSSETDRIAGTVPAQNERALIQRVQSSRD